MGFSVEATVWLHYGYDRYDCYEYLRLTSQDVLLSEQDTTKAEQWFSMWLLCFEMIFSRDPNYMDVANADPLLRRLAWSWYALACFIIYQAMRDESGNVDETTLRAMLRGQPVERTGETQRRRWQDSRDEHVRKLWQVATGGGE